MIKGQNSTEIIEFYKNKKVLITGNTGFKGSWLSCMLLNMGANVFGYALEPNTVPSIFEIINMSSRMQTTYGDIREYDKLKSVFDSINPEIVIHLAAQPIVLEGYNNPRNTYEVNVMGTVNVLECSRHCKSVKSILNVTTDKVYRNNEWEWGYRENEFLDGYDPYSNSKSCSELVTATYKRSYFDDLGIPLSTARAGNVIGGGDFSENRIIPDCVRAAEKSKEIIVRNPNSVRPYQHVLEPLKAYLLITMKQYDSIEAADNYNVGPEFDDCLTTGKIASLFCDKWGDKLQWKSVDNNGPHEANFLKLDCSKIKNKLEWKTTWNVEKAIEKTVEWHKAKNNGLDMYEFTTSQIEEFL